MTQFPEANAKTRVSHDTTFVEGPVTNATITCSYPGTEVDLLIPIGKYVFSEFIVNTLNGMVHKNRLTKHHLIRTGISKIVN